MCVLLLASFICTLKEWVEHPISLGGATDPYMYVFGGLAGLGLKFIHHR